MKRRSESLEARLTAEQRRELLDQLCVELISYDDAVEWCGGHGIETSKSSIGRFYQRNAFNHRLELAKEAAEQTADVLPEEIEAATKRVLTQKVFELVARADADPRAVLKVREQDLKAENLKLLERRVVVAEAKLHQVEEVAKDDALSAEEKDHKLKTIFKLN
jgi:hypothetical protein